MESAIKLKDVMALERLLLEIDVRYKFKLKFEDAYKLYGYLRDIGRITNYAFELQSEFHSKYGDDEKLKKYHDNVMRSSLILDCGDVTNFIDFVGNTFGDDEFNKILDKNKFWM